jgi:hypothetical protein
MNSEQLYNATIKSVEQSLKEQRINYEFTNWGDGSGTCNFELMIGSQSAWLQIEETLNVEEPSVEVHFYDDPNILGYDQTEEVKNFNWDPTSEIEGLISFIKGKIRAESKIQSYIEKIVDLCKENSLELNDYISINHPDMDI